MEEHIGTIGILGFLATLVAEQLCGGWLHKKFMAFAALLTAIAVTYAVHYVGDAADFGVSFRVVQELSVEAVWAYGLLVFVASHYTRRGLKAVAPALANPSVRIGDLVGALIVKESTPSVTMDVLPGDDVWPGDTLRDKENTNIYPTVTQVLGDQLVVIINGATHTLPRSRFQWFNVPRR